MIYSLICSDMNSSYLIAKYKTLSEAENARNNLVYNTKEFQFEKLKILSTENNEEVRYEKD